jgi:hypothetical protein
VLSAVCVCVQQYEKALTAIVEEDKTLPSVLPSADAPATDTKSSAPTASAGDAKSDGPSANVKLRAIGRVSWLHVSSGADVLSLLLTSERVFTDLHDWLQYGEPEQVVLREYEPELTVENEFRVFVYHNQITGITQYESVLQPHTHARARRSRRDPAGFFAVCLARVQSLCSVSASVLRQVRD